jgi:hypothetical protein
MATFKRILDPGKIAQNIYSDASQTQRTANAGLAIKPIGELSAAKRVGKASTIMVYNSGNSVAYVAFGDQSVSSPANPSSGIPVLAGEKAYLNSGDDAWIRSSSNSVYGYLAVGDELDA